MRRIFKRVTFLVPFFFLMFSPALNAAWLEEVYIEESGYYRVLVNFEFYEQRSLNAVGTVVIDGQTAPADVRYFNFPRRIVYADFPFLTDAAGNDRMPNRVQLLRPDSFTINTPFFMEQGAREIFINVNGYVNVLGIEIQPFTPTPTYEEYRQLLASVAYFPIQNQLITIEAQLMTYKSGMNIVPSSMSGAGITPQESGVRRLNVVGQTSFDGEGDFAEWRFTVEEDGFYYLTFKYMQNVNINLNSYRRIYINGEVPFREFYAAAFPFTTRWRNLTFENYPVFLYAGENSIRLAVTAAPYADIQRDLLNTVGAIRGLDMNLRQIIGNEVDPFRIWNLESYIPDISERLLNYAYELENIMAELSALTGFGVNEYRALQSAVRDLRRFAERPDSLARTAHSLSQVVGPLTDWLIALERQPIVLDKFFVHTADADIPPAVPNFFVRFLHALRNFFASFARAATTTTDTEVEGIQVWVRRSRDYVDLMQRMSDDIFTPLYGIPVSVNFIPDTTVLILANAAGTLPELAGGMDINVPFEYAIRGALADLTRFDGFEALAAPMASGALIPYKHMGGIFALPEEVIFNVLYYRTDIAENLGLTAPDTWDDVLNTVPVLTRNGSTFFYPYGDFQTFFAQRGVPIYSPDGLTLVADTEEGFAAFRFWTDLYVKHGLPARMDSFYQHFRMGTAPMGVAPINEYIRFRLTAPDIAGQWRVAPIPGTINEDGFINRSQAGGQNGMMMFNTTPEREAAAWTFMQWWLSTETQIQFAQNLENFYGPEFRWYTANFDVLSQLDWRPETMAVFQEQLSWYSPVPLVPGGSYMTGREIWNAWTRVVIRQEHYREQLEIAFRDIRLEMERKQIEFGITDIYGNRR